MPDGARIAGHIDSGFFIAFVGISTAASIIYNGPFLNWPQLSDWLTCLLSFLAIVLLSRGVATKSPGLMLVYIIWKITFVIAMGVICIFYILFTSGNSPSNFIDPDAYTVMVINTIILAAWIIYSFFAIYIVFVCRRHIIINNFTPASVYYGQPGYTQPVYAQPGFPQQPPQQQQPYYLPAQPQYAQPPPNYQQQPQVQFSATQVQEQGPTAPEEPLPETK